MATKGQVQTRVGGAFWTPCAGADGKGCPSGKRCQASLTPKGKVPLCKLCARQAAATRLPQPDKAEKLLYVAGGLFSPVQAATPKATPKGKATPKATPKAKRPQRKAV